MNQISTEQCAIYSYANTAKRNAAAGASQTIPYTNEDAVTLFGELQTHLMAKFNESDFAIAIIKDPSRLKDVGAFHLRVWDENRA